MRCEDGRFVGRTECGVHVVSPELDALVVYGAKLHIAVLND
jgi:hypothetical protein